MRNLLKIHEVLVWNMPFLAGIVIVLQDYYYAVAYAIGGWMIYLVNYIFFIAIAEISRKTQPQRKQVIRMMLFWLPLVLTVFWDGADGFYSFLIATGSFECLALALAIIFIFIGATGVDGLRSFDSLGASFAIIAISLFVAGAAPYFLVSLEYIQQGDRMDLYTFCGIILYQMIFAVGDIKLVRDSVQSGLYKENTDFSVLILVMLFGWLIILNVLRIF